MIRGFTIALSLIVALLYTGIFIFLEPIFQFMEGFEPGPNVIMNIKFFALTTIGFCIGCLGQVFTDTRYKRTRWNIVAFIKMSIIPIIMLLAISLNPVVDLFTSLPLIRDNPAEFYTYIVPTRYLWFLWIGFGLGSSIKFQNYYIPKRAYSSPGEKVSVK